MEEWINEGDLVILMIDVNKRLQKYLSRFRPKMEFIGLNKCILNHHSSLYTPPAISSGTNIIYNIFGTGSLDVINDGYASFVGYMDHILV